ncbi:hypothetical protein Tsubulata_045223 [Turnera subulata]|uniref:ATP-dependent Clp protease proteolytic subunit n=1 Tax=Turnera subulata TaxID=218843 RepID=A0A9Q0FEB5_9ROSI|nr:hypothetical protein Tsubulata_045223 [Turnera subulata]
MATGLQVLPLAFSLLSSSSSSSSTPLNSQCPRKRTHTLNLKCYALPYARNSPGFTLTYDPNDPFVRKLASVPAEPLAGRDQSSDHLPFLDLFTPTKVMSAAGTAESAPSSDPEVGEFSANSPPDPSDDMETKLFYHRVVYIGMPLVSIISELVVAQLLYLQADSNRPIYMYINSTGTTRADGQPDSYLRWSFCGEPHKNILSQG